LEHGPLGVTSKRFKYKELIGKRGYGMNEKATIAGQEATLRRIKKRIIPHEQSDPSSEPLFINFVHGAVLGDDYYLDVGVITLESIDPEEPLSGVGDFIVLNRLAMSKRTIEMMRDQINSVLAKTGQTSAT
jgi:hypothetical protein